MRILVTGGAGFVGSHLCEQLVAKDHDVLCMDNLITGRTENIFNTPADTHNPTSFHGLFRIKNHD